MYIDHVGINTNDMEATLQFYCGILGMRLVRTTRTPDGRRHYNVEIGGGNAFAVFDGAELPTAGERQHVNHLALPVDTLEEFDAAYQRLKDHGVAVTEIIERGYGKTFYFLDPNGIRLEACCQPAAGEKPTVIESVAQSRTSAKSELESIDRDWAASTAAAGRFK